MPLARAAERSSALKLLTQAFFLLKAYFCAETEEAKPRRSTRNALPRLTVQGVRQGSYAFPHAGWRDVIRAWRCRGVHIGRAQPCYTLCTMTRERSVGRPSVFRLVNEHDGKLLLVARQRYAGEGDFLIFAMPEEEEERRDAAGKGVEGEELVEADEDDGN